MKGNIQTEEKASGEVRYKAYIDLPTDGKRQRKTKTHKTKEAAERWLVKMNYLLNEQVYFEPSEMVLNDFFDVWIKRKRNSVSASTVEKYEWALNHIREALGSVPINKITPYHIDKFYEDKLEELSSSSVKILGDVLEMVFSLAVEERLLKENPTKHVTKPQPENKEMKVLTEDQVKRLLKNTQGDWPYHYFYSLAISTGMRQSELRGLKWKDVKFNDRKIIVRRQLKKTNGYNFEFGELKTESSRRTIPITEATTEKLKDHRKILKEKIQEAVIWEYPDLVFPSKKGEILKPPTLRDNFNRHLEEAELPKIRLQDLRHTCATLLLSKGVNPKAVAERLGHSRVSTTLDVYSQVLPDIQGKALEELDGLMQVGDN